MLYANKQADEWFRSIIDKPETFPFAFSFDGIEYHGFPEESFTLTGQESCEGDGVLHIERNYRLCGLLDAHLICTISITAQVSSLFALRTTATGKVPSSKTPAPSFAS